jgi:predicted amidohydrolase YtcJ
MKNPTTRISTVIAALALLVVLAGSGPRASPKPAVDADLLLLNAHVVTLDARTPTAEAVAVQGDRIAWVGSTADARKQFPSASRTVDLHGATVLPGIIDAHTHMCELGKSFLRLNLKDAASVEDVVERVKLRVATAAPNEWILGWGWDEGQWAAHYPDNRALNEVSPNNPVFLVGLHTFAGWANDKALRAAAIDRYTKDPENGKILRNEKTGEPTGMLLNHAQDLVTKHIPPMTLEQEKQAIALAAQECVRNGLTSVHDANVSPMMLQAFRELLNEGHLPVRVYVMLDGADHALIDQWLARGPEIDPQHRLTIRAIKLFADGALGSRGAAMLEPYSDAPQTKGLMTTSGDQVYDVTRRSLAKGYQACTHAIGDAANRAVLDAYERAMKETPRSRDPRLRIEHAQILAPDDIPRFAKLKIIPSMQPTHCTSDMAWAENRVGPVRIQGAYAWQSLLKTGVHLPLSSDFPGETLNPFFGIYAAVTRQAPDGKPAGGWHPEQRLTLEQALRGYTIEGAYAEFEENAKGSIEKGKLADFTVIADDITHERPEQILATKVLKTIVGGKIAYDSDGTK